MNDEQITIDRLIVEPTENGPRDLGCARRTIIDGKQVVQLYFAENDDGFGKMVSRRTTTRRGKTHDETFDPPIPIDELPEPPRDAAPEMPCGTHEKKSKPRKTVAGNSPAAA